MQDAAETLRAVLDAEWNLSDTLAKTNIVFRRGEPEDLETRFSNRNISIEVGKLTRPVTKRVLNKSISRELVPITAWLLVHPSSNEGKLAAMNNRQSIEDEIERIIKLKQRELTDLRFAKIVNARYISSRENEPHALGVVFDTQCQYVK